MSRRGILFVVVILGWLAPTSGVADTGWQAGVATTVITPTESMWMSGYGSRDHPSEGKLTELYAKALVLQDESGRQVVLVTFDLVGIDRQMSQNICERLQDEFGLQRDQIALCASHTHTGPAVGRNLAPLHYLQLSPTQQALVDAYTERFESQVVATVGAALNDLEPARVEWGNGHCTVAVNRRENRPENEVPQRRAAGRLSGPSDYDVPVLAVRDASDQLQAVVFGYACHATVLSFYQWSGDYPGFAQQALENAYGCTALFWAGCGGDQNPLPRRTVELAQEHGQRLASGVDQVLRGRMRPIAPRLTTNYEEIPLRLGDLPDVATLESDAESTNRFIAARARMLLDEIAEGTPLREDYPYPIARWQLGDEVDWLFMGGEVVIDYALRLKAERADEATWVAGYANDVMAYIPSRRVLIEGGYEGAGAMIYYGLPTAWSLDVEEQIVNGIEALGAP